MSVVKRLGAVATNPQDRSVHDYSAIYFARELTLLNSPLEEVKIHKARTIENLSLELE